MGASRIKDKALKVYEATLTVLDALEMLREFPKMLRGNPELPDEIESNVEALIDTYALRMLAVTDMGFDALEEQNGER